MKMNSNNVWVEKYRPTQFDRIVLDPLNRQLLQNMIDTGYFPHLLLYGPPGTGKTTTIMNLIQSYQRRWHSGSGSGSSSKEWLIHLNASDERGIDIIRSQISQFVQSGTLFHKGIKFVILDEADYMTKGAQQALRYLLPSCGSSVRICLICNYMNRIDKGLQNELLRLRFNQLPESDILSFLQTISQQEQLNMSDGSLHVIQRRYKSDIRSMINFMQSNQHVNDHDLRIADESVWNEWLRRIEQPTAELSEWNAFVQQMVDEYHTDIKKVVKELLNHIIRTRPDYVCPALFRMMDNVIHMNNIQPHHLMNYVLLSLHSLRPTNDIIKESTSDSI